MKKIFALFLTLCLMASTFCISAFAENMIDSPAFDLPTSAPTDAPASTVPTDGTVIRVSGLKRDGDVVEIEKSKNHAEGWEAATDYAKDSNYMKANDYDRIVVDLYADWNAVDSEFCNSGDGFNYDAIRFYNKTRITLNMNGHTINRGVEKWQYNGEVIYVASDADVIINDGTITGGFSCNGAGGIHIDDDATVVLNNVNVIGNKVEDDDGAGIAIYDSATLTMNGGSISDNICLSWADNKSRGCGIYVNDSTVIFNGVTISNNQFKDYYHGNGAAIYADDSDVTLENCKVIGNGKDDDAAKFVGTDSVIYGTGSNLSFISTIFEGNGSPIRSGSRESSLIYSKFSLYMSNCEVTENHTVYLIDSEGKQLSVSDTIFTDNDANTFYGYGRSDEEAFVRCTFNNNASSSAINDIHAFNFTDKGTTFIDCDMGNSTFNNEKYAKFIDADTGLQYQDDTSSARVGSVLGEGSIAMIVAILALVASLASVGISVASNKKRSALTADTDEE